MRYIFITHCVFIFMFLANVPVISTEWVNDTKKYFGHLPVPLRIIAVADWDNTMMAGFFGTWENRTNVVWYCRGEGMNDVSSAYNNFSMGGDREIYRLCWSSLDFPSLIVSAVVADLNRDGVLDILLQCENGSLYFVNGRRRNDQPKIIFQETVPVFNAHIPQVSLVSVFSHCGLPELALVNTEGSLVLMRATTEMFFGARCMGTETVPTFEQMVLEKGKRNVSEVVPLSLVSEDIDGDCGADLLFTVYQRKSNALMVYAFFQQDSQKKLLLKLHQAHRYGFPSTADVNGDGAPDIIFPICDFCNTSILYGEGTQFNGLIVFFNQLRGFPPCTSDGCCKGHPYGFSKRSSLEVFLYDGNACGINTSKDVPLVMTSSLASPLLIRSGDFNGDGYVDLLVPSTYGPLLLVAKVNRTGHMFFDCTPVDGASGNSSFGDRSAYIRAIPFFVPVVNNERLDILLTYHDGNALPVTLYANHPSQLDINYFFTSGALNGAASEHNWGVYQPGAVHRFGWNDIMAQQRWSYGTQMSRSQGHVLQFPRLIFGLGKTFFYIEGYAVGIVTDLHVTYRLWTAAFMPNSTMFAWLNPLLSPGDWKQLLYIFFATNKSLLLVLLVTFLIVVGLPIVFSKLREVRRDRREWNLR